MGASLLDIKVLEAHVDKEIADEHLKDARNKLVTKRREIKRAERIVRNLEREYQLLLLEITDDA